MKVDVMHQAVTAAGRSVRMIVQRSATGCLADFQIGLVAAADSDMRDAYNAWVIFEERSIKPNYAVAPQFAVIPRSLPK